MLALHQRSDLQRLPLFGDGFGTGAFQECHVPYAPSPFETSCILEMRKEKSRDAARSRRGKENYEFYELAKMLPLPGAITTQLDKASIIRLTISFLKLKEFTAHGDPPWRKDGPTLKSGSLRPRSVSSVAIDLFEQHQATHILQSLDGFAFALGADGRFLYISETVSIYLGLSQVEMTGSSVFDYVHQQDQSELADLIGINMCSSPSAASPPASVASDDGSSSNPGPSTPTGFDRPPPTMTLPTNNAGQSLQRSFCVRMKSTLTKRGCHFKSSGYRVVLVLSHLRPQYNFSASSRKQTPTIMGLVGLAIALPPPSVNELRLESDMFVTRLTFDFRISHCEPRVSELLDYTAEEITGTSMYTLCYAQDIEKLRKCHIDLIQKGQVMSGYYRLMNKNGGYTWLQSCATVICNTKNAEEETIICVNYVLSNVEYPHCVMDFSQLPSSRDLRNDDPSSSERGTSPDKEGGRDNSASGDVDIEQRPTPRPDNTSERTDEGQTYDRVTDLDVDANKRDRSHRGSEKSCNSSPKTREFPGVVYFGPPTSERETTNDSMDDRQHQGGRQRKRKPTENLPGSSETNDTIKSPRPGSSSSASLEVLSMDNGTGYNDVSSNDLVVDDMSCNQTGVSSSGSRGRGASSSSPDKSDKVTRPWTRSPAAPSAYDPNCMKTSSTMSVKDLEDVMNRHLPQHNGSPGGSSPDVLMLKSFPPTAGSPTQRPIQWIAGHPAPASLPATTLLRQIYVSRESVIRSAGAHATRHGCYGDAIQGTLPTPPGGQGSDPPYGDLMLQSAAKLSESSSPYSQTGASYLDNCNAMTPPSSVSPRDNFNEAAAVAAAAAMPHMRHYMTATDPNSLQHLPLKPHQLFVHPSNLDHPGVPYGHHHGQQTLSPDQHQSLYHHPSSFHLYHPPPGGSKTALHTTNGNSWFCQPHS
ncbi:protein trachealess-like isoform X2 [Stegodyphus dumicola]|uniref:protein trachealess-like isoform X2 n=2 Tax=Stegodyphus dumicola TaxID=202533 RepID=UPI0015ADBD05|nr:protein trachealess-like isoform X2 [Stegodyphus dumicola]